MSESGSAFGKAYFEAGFAVDILRTAAGNTFVLKPASFLKKYSLEMGGKNPLILLKDFDVDQAVKIAGFGAFFHQGQICMCTSRIIAEEPVYEEFCEKFAAYAKTMKVGDPHEQDTMIGPLIKKEQCLLIDRQIEDAVAKGAVLMTGGTHKGTYYQPTVLKDVTPDMKIFYEESFGPVTSVIKAKDAEDAVRLCNDNEYGLSSSLLTNDLSEAMSLSLEMEAGMVHVNNATVSDNSTVAFGGVKNSGVGREGGSYSIDEFTELKWITLQYTPAQFPF